MQAAKLSLAYITKRLQVAQQHALDALVGIVQIAPTQLHSLAEIIRDRFPHKRFPRTVQRSYLQHILKLCLFESRLTAPVLATVLERLVQIDADITDDGQSDDDDTEEDSDDESTGGLSTAKNSDNDADSDNEMFTMDTTDTKPRTARYACCLPG